MPLAAVSLAATPLPTRDGLRAALVGAVSNLVGDGFNRPDSALSLGTADTGQAWKVGNVGDAATLPAWGLSGGAAYLASGGTQGDPMAYIDALLSDCSVQARVALSTKASGAYEGLLYRRQDASNYFGLRVINSGNELSILRCLAGVRSQVAATTSGITFSNGQTITLALTLRGPIVYGFIDGVLRLTYSDANMQSATRHGLIRPGSTAGAPTWDDFRVTR